MKIKKAGQEALPAGCGKRTRVFSGKSEDTRAFALIVR